jgi:hypothetical protein
MSPSQTELVAAGLWRRSPWSAVEYVILVFSCDIRSSLYRRRYRRQKRRDFVGILPYFDTGVKHACFGAAKGRPRRRGPSTSKGVRGPHGAAAEEVESRKGQDFPMPRKIR